MAEESFHGVPRSKISWGPTIDYEKCISCGKCVDYCHMEVFTFEEKEGKKQSVVKNYNNCVVLCTGCEDQCPAGAIMHPSKEETLKAVRKLQKAQA